MNIPVVIIATSRSGTSTLGRILDRHLLLSAWINPYYISSPHSSETPHDMLIAKDASNKILYWIRKAFKDYHQSSNYNVKPLLSLESR